MRAEKIDALTADITDAVCMDWNSCSKPDEYNAWHEMRNIIKKIVRKHCNKSTKDVME